MSMKPHSVAIGERFVDESGWDRLVEVQTLPEPTAWITLGGGRISISVGSIPWLIEALTTALALVQGDTE